MIVAIITLGGIHCLRLGLLAVGVSTEVLGTTIRGTGSVGCMYVLG